MRRRDIIPGLVAGLGLVRWTAIASQTLDRFLPASQGGAVLLDIRSRRLIAAANVASTRLLFPPGSTLKPFVLAALLRDRKLDANASFVCPGRLRIGTRVLDCSHPSLAVPMRVDTALAYSCNCFVAHAAERFATGELSRELEVAGLGARTGLAGDAEAVGRIRVAESVDAQRLQALGEDGVLITVAELAVAYRLLALKLGTQEMRPILTGLEGAVEYGTAQHARVDGAKVAGKTGTALTSAAEPIAWFAGFLPSAAPEVALAVMVPGRSGGADAAPVARRIFETYREGRL